MSSNEIRVTFSRFVYSIIDFFSSNIEYNFEVSSYLTNEENAENKDNIFLNRKICKFISRNNMKLSKSRFFLIISIDDMNLCNIEKSHKILKDILYTIDTKFYTCNILDYLECLNPDCTFKVLSKHTNNTLDDYILIIFNFPNHTSFEVIISTQKLSKKILERDEFGDVLEYHSKLNKNIKCFEEIQKKYHD